MHFVWIITVIIVFVNAIVLALEASMFVFVFIKWAKNFLKPTIISLQHSISKTCSTNAFNTKLLHSLPQNLCPSLPSLASLIIIIIIIQFWSSFIPVNEGGQIYPTLPAISPTPTLHLARFFASSFFKPTLLLSFSTCDLHVFLGRPRFLFPFQICFLCCKVQSFKVFQSSKYVFFVAFILISLFPIIIVRCLTTSYGFTGQLMPVLLHWKYLFCSTGKKCFTSQALKFWDILLEKSRN